MVWKIIDESQIRNKFTLLMFICSVLVIFIHAKNITEIVVGNSPTFLDRIAISIESYWSEVTKIAVPYFFMISGFLFFRTFEISKLSAKWGGELRLL